MVSYRLMRQTPARVYFSDRENVRLGQFSHAVPDPFRVRAVPSFISFILAVSNPSKVAGSIVQAIAVPVASLMMFRRTRAVKCQADRHMQIHFLVFSQGKSSVKTSGRAFQNIPSIWLLASGLVEENTIHRPDAPKARRFVTRMTGHLAPLFDFVYRVISHIALLQRVGQGMAEGCNQPSFPIYNRRQNSATGITLLAART